MWGPSTSRKWAVSSTVHSVLPGAVCFIPSDAMERASSVTGLENVYSPALRQLMDIFEPSNFTILDAENLRSHYARTLEHWLERFEDSTLEVPETFGPEFVRTWRLYLAGSIAGFRVGTLQLFQIVFARAACQRIPSTRAQLYHARHDETQEADVSSTSLH